MEYCKFCIDEKLFIDNASSAFLVCKKCNFYFRRGFLEGLNLSESGGDYISIFNKFLLITINEVSKLIRITCIPETEEEKRDLFIKTKNNLEFL